MTYYPRQKILRGGDYLKEVGYYDEDSHDDEDSDRELTTTIAKLIRAREQRRIHTGESRKHTYKH